MNNEQLTIISDCEFKLDGGAMFGIVPRSFWEKVAKPDDRNRVRLGLNCVFIETAGERILIETGIGEKWSAKEVDIYGIDRRKTLAETLLEQTGRGVDEITIVVNTHLHFDHAGGNTIFDTDGVSAIPQFPNARYFVSQREFEHAENPHERDRASYRPDDWRPLVATGQLELKPDDYDVVEGLSMTTIRGHSETMQTWKFESNGRVYYGFADLIPTTAHLAPAWIMGYDLYPVETLEAKKELLPRAASEDWRCVFYHDANSPLAGIKDAEGRFEISCLLPYNQQYRPNAYTG